MGRERAQVEVELGSSVGDITRALIRAYAVLVPVGSSHSSSSNHIQRIIGLFHFRE